MDTNFKGTQGEVKYHEYNNSKILYRFAIHSSNGDSICKILRDDNDNPEVEKANADLIVEAFNVRQQIPYSLTELKEKYDKAIKLLDMLDDSAAIPSYLMEDYEEVMEGEDVQED